MKKIFSLFLLYGGCESSEIQSRYCQMLWIEVWIGKGLSDFLQHTIFKFHVLGDKIKLFKALQSSPALFRLLAEFESHGFCDLYSSAINVSTVGVFLANGGKILLTNFSVTFLSSTLGSFTSTFPQAV